ncbi:Biopolymer transport protein ExbD [Pontiella desulfatans]|uniref:Biopolymer transport protein ExbD n=1 Tax=Pontiella desulfatans TaxID=2750659 RepID=A0A6C2U3F9_PONDE|nr:biopolymer transporter ExbD [Pontiella desulfatans]VGO14530.1 Biopolymer transport protein ExbD [Pontiella desulfatans]
MKLEQKDIGDDLELDMSPMIDMVFLLLIFFIVASQIVDEKPKVEIPAAAYAKVPEDTTGRLMITVKKDDTFYLASDREPKTIEQVKERIEQEINANPELRVLIRADGEVKYKTNEKVTIACAEVGAQDLIYSVFEE